MLDYNNLSYHPFSEKIVNALCQKVGTQHKHFFRIHVAYYLSILASMMRTNVDLVGSGTIPVNMYAINLAPSGFGKGHSTRLIESSVIHKFQQQFINKDFLMLADENLPKLAAQRAARDGVDFDIVLKATIAELKSKGKLLFSFDSATPAAVEQTRHMLLMANAGSLNLQTDEIGANLSGNRDVMMLFLELFDGVVKNKLIKNTADSIRSEEIQGTTPTNMMLFGVGAGILDDGKVEDEFQAMLQHGFPRRCFFGYIPEDHTEELNLMTPDEMLAFAKQGNADTVLEDAANYLKTLSSYLKAHKNIVVPDETAKLYFQYKNDCLIRSRKLKVTDTLMVSELSQRPFKTLKLAGTLSFIDQTAEMTPDQFKAAVALAEDSGKNFKKLMKRDRAYVKLAKYLAKQPEEATQADLVEDLTFYANAKTKTQRDQMMVEAIAYGYKNSIIIKKRYADSIEFFSGESLTETNLDKITVSYSQDITEGYIKDKIKFNKLHQLVQADGYHWINHELLHDYRTDDFCIPGFNIVVIDVDSGISLQAAKTLMTGYKAMYYTTKRSTPEKERFRIILPTNYELKLDKPDFKEFMKNVFEWLPFDSDEATGQRARKWLSHKGHHEYTDGKLLDVLPFIPKTSKNEERKRQFKDLQSLNNFERWIIMNTGDGNRNNQLHNYAQVLIENNYSAADIQAHLLELNSKMIDKLDDAEILRTIMTTVNRKIAG